MYKNEYVHYVICKAAQVVTLDHDNKTLDYHEVDEVYDNEHLQIYDVTNNCPVGHIDHTPDDEEMYELTHKMIMEYEEKQKSSSDDLVGAFSN